MKTVFFTIVGDSHYYAAGTPMMINSFKRFHPDIDLIVYRQDAINQVFAEKGVNFYNAKPTFAKLLTDKYDLVVNVDCDHLFMGRCEEILKGDYDVACPINKNDYENTSVENVTEDMYLQGGLVASTNKEFWDIWEQRNRYAMEYRCKENDTMNLVIYNDPTVSKMKLKILDKDKDYYGCKSLGREKEFYLEDGKVMCRNEQVVLYHIARGGIRKPTFSEMGCSTEVVNYTSWLGHGGVSVIYTTL